jgi:hypothetical protein
MATKAKRAKRTRGGKPPPVLLFAEQFRRLCESSPLPDSLEALSTTNVVLLATLTLTPAQAYRHGKWFRGVAPPVLSTQDSVARFSHVPAGRSAAHYRIRCGPPAPGRVPDGKYLVFGTKSVIRAGKHSHPDAVAATLRMIRCLRNIKLLHPASSYAALSCPNTVVTGRSKRDVVKANLEVHWRAHSTLRFPGVAVNIPGGSIVPEVYCSDNRFIMPGVRTPGQLHAAALSLMECLDECSSSSSSSTQ